MSSPAADPRTPEGPRTPAGATGMIDLPGLHDSPGEVALLVEMSGADAGRVHRLTGGETTLGRDAECALCFDDGTISRVHARIVGKGHDLVFEDAGSLNGSFVNHARTDRCVLQHGDRVRLGSVVRFQFQRASEEEAETLVRIYEAGVRDGLTGAYNRRHLEERLASEFSFALRHGTELCVMIADLDHFKRVNDEHGHLAGDLVLRETVILMQGQLRHEDLLARYGGEEFAIVVRSIPMASALILAERVRRSIADAVFDFEGVQLRITASLGVVSMVPGATVPGVNGFLARADQSLYRAKASGRNRVVGDA